MNSSLKHIVSQLENLTRQDISIDVGLDMLESSAKTLKDVITINVMRDSYNDCLLYTSPSPRDLSTSRMPSSA